MSITFNQLKKLITKKEIDTVLVCVSDMQGRLNGKRVTGKAFIDYVYKETHMCDYLYTVDMEMFTVPGYKSSSWETGYGDMTVIPDLKTIKTANWLNKTALVLCDCLDHSGKKPLIHSTRQILKDVLAKADKMGFKSMVGSELEFFLFNQTYEEIHNNNYTKLKESSWYIEDYMIFQTTKEEDVMQELRNSLLDSGIYVECSKGEAAPGQEEINVVFSDALNMADNHILIKNATKEIAYKHNKAVTFMAKYNKEVCGSSCHIHNSLFDKKTNKNIFYNPKDKYGMSDIFKSYLAVEAAKNSYNSRVLVDMPLLSRAKLMRKIAEETRKVSKEGGELLCYENGKNIASAIKEFNDVADMFDYYAGLTDKLEGKTIPVAKNIFDYTILEPFGVSAHVVPWNFPLSMIGRSLSCSFATGNSTIIKTAELTPLSATIFAKAIQNADVPEGLINIICGYGNEAGSYLVSHEDVNHVVFTGSVATGKKYFTLVLIKLFLL